MNGELHKGTGFCTYHYWNYVNDGRVGFPARGMSTGDLMMDIIIQIRFANGPFTSTTRNIKVAEAYAIKRRGGGLVFQVNPNDNRLVDPVLELTRLSLQRPLDFNQNHGKLALDLAEQEDEILVGEGVFHNEIVDSPHEVGRIPSTPCDGKG